MADEKVTDSIWTREQDIAFEHALVTYPDEDSKDRWEKIASDVPGKLAEEIKNHYELLLEDLERIESGVVPLLAYTSSLDDSESHAGDGGTTSKKGGNQNTNESSHGGKVSKSDQERRKGIAWTEDELRIWFLGLMTSVLMGKHQKLRQPMGP